MASLVASAGPLERTSGDGQRSVEQEQPSSEVQQLGMESASLRLSGSSHRPSNDKFLWQSSERLSFDRLSHEKRSGALERQAHEQSSGGVGREPNKKLPAYSEQQVHKKALDALDRQVNDAATSASHLDQPERTASETALNGQAIGSLADGRRLQKGPNGLVAGGPYIVNTPSGRQGNVSNGEGLFNTAAMRSQSDTRSSGEKEAEALSPRQKSDSRPLIDGEDASNLANGTAVNRRSNPSLESPRGISDSTSSSRQRRAHSASNSDVPRAMPLSFDPDLNLSNRVCSPPNDAASSMKPTSPPSPTLPRLQHRHTLQVPKASAHRGSRDLAWTANNTSEDALSTAVSPATALRRSSLNLVRRTTRSAHSDLYTDDIPQDADAVRWAEKIQQKRMSRHRRREEEEDDRVMVGTKVDQNHVNWVTAYNMLTGIRFTVSRTNAKLDRDLTDADFVARHKFSFDITGNELTPSAKYDFKFKDYAPWVFRHLRAQFHLDPADYLISLTSKYILSELGSPGKSGSFFYFSRDYKYIIKTIHQSEHKMLRSVLKEYYNHVIENPNTLISQFYGLHRVKIPRGRKIHFVVMNNLFPPHRDIHHTFDLKGSTIGRDFREEDLTKNPRATLKDLNWIRRNYHLELGPDKKRLFVEQMGRDVALLQRLHIMDYSLLVGIHDITKGNDENLRDKTLQVFEPGGDGPEGPSQRDGAVAGSLARTPSKQEKARKARELRQAIKRERPVPMDMSTLGIPNSMMHTRKNFYFYSDDGGLRATHDDGTPGEQIYYLGIIDCLTRYGFVKRIENFIKGMSGHESQISPVPPEFYGERFIKFISGITMSREEAERQKSMAQDSQGNVPIVKHNSGSMGGARQSSQDVLMERAEREAAKGSPDGRREDEKPERTLATTRSPSADRNAAAGATLPILEEVGEGASVGGRSAHSSRGNLRDQRGETLGQALPTREPMQQSHTLSPLVGGRPPPTPPKDPPQDAAPTLPEPTLVDSPITFEPKAM